MEWQLTKLIDLGIVPIISPFLIKEGKFIYLERMKLKS